MMWLSRTRLITRRSGQQSKRESCLTADRVSSLELPNLLDCPGWKPPLAYLMRGISRAGFKCIRLSSTAQPDIDDKYLCRLFAAPGASALRSRSIFTCAAERSEIGQSGIRSGEPGGSRRQSSIIARD